MGEFKNEYIGLSIQFNILVHDVTFMVTKHSYNDDINIIYQEIKYKGELVHMKTWEAIKSIEEGKKVRLSNWKEWAYIYKNNFGIIVDQDNETYSISDMSLSKWEIFYDEREDIPEYLIWIRHVSDFFNNKCNPFACEDCEIHKICDSNICYEINEFLKQVNRTYKVLN